MPMFEGFRGLCMYFLVVAPNGLDDDNGGLDHKPVQSRSPVGAASSPRLGARRAEDGAPTAVDGLTIKAK
jgi:hypothetical protein